MKLVEVHARKVSRKQKNSPFTIHLLADRDGNAHLIRHVFEDGSPTDEFRFDHPSGNLDLLRHVAQHGDMNVEFEPAEGEGHGSGYTEES